MPVQKQTVRVVFVEVASGVSFAESDCPPEMLPESFEAHTTFTIAGSEWEVLSAAPMTRAEYVAAGELFLRVRKMSVRNVPAEEILYSLPTICDALPSIAEGSTKLSKRVLELDEDDWRQIELVSTAHRDEIRSCLARVERIYAEEQTAEGGFKNLYVRSEVPSPLAQTGLTLDALRARLAPLTTLYEGLAYVRAAGVIDGGFAFETGASIAVYGTAQAGTLAAVGFLWGELSGALEPFAESLAGLLLRHNLVLVDWCRVHVVEADPAQVLAYLTA